MVADALPRPPNGSYVITVIITILTIDLPSENEETIRKEQLTDPDIAKIHNDFECDYTNDHFARWTDRICDAKWCWYHRNEETDAEEAQLVITDQNRMMILEAHHNSPMAGHNSAEPSRL